MTSESKEDNDKTTTATEEYLGTTYGWVKETVTVLRAVENEMGEADRTTPPDEVTANKSWKTNGVTIFTAEVFNDYHRGGVQVWVGLIFMTIFPGLPELEAGAVWESEESARDFCEAVIESWLHAFPDLAEQLHQVTRAGSEEE